MPKKKNKIKPADIPVQKVMCATCPWRRGSPYAYLVAMLSKSAATEANRICHSTGTSSIVYPNGTGKPDRICRGARNVQLAVFFGAGLLSEPTDAAWYAKVEELRKAGSKI